MNKKFYNHELLIGAIIGVLSITSVYAANNYISSKIFYDNSSSMILSSNIQEAIDEIDSRLDSIDATTCPNWYLCNQIKQTTSLKLGDYVVYTPPTDSFTTDTTKTNAASTQTILPSELNLWRVFNINDNGTIELISENISSVGVCFNGLVGYKNYVGYLNELASKYEDENYTVESRHIGYNGQTEYLTNFTNSWSCSTDDSGCNNTESSGGGDKLYLKDYEQLYHVLGQETAYPIGSSSSEAYWIASREYSQTSTYRNWHARYLHGGDFPSDSSFSYYLYYYRISNSKWTENEVCRRIRPIVTIKSGLIYEGLGIKDIPWQIVGDSSASS